MFIVSICFFLSFTLYPAHSKIIRQRESSVKLSIPRYMCAYIVNKLNFILLLSSATKLMECLNIRILLVYYIKGYDVSGKKRQNYGTEEFANISQTIKYILYLTDFCKKERY